MPRAPTPRRGALLEREHPAQLDDDLQTELAGAPAAGASYVHMHPHDAGNGRRAHDAAPARALVLGVARLHESPQAKRRGGDLLSLEDRPVDRDRHRHDHGEPVLAAVPDGY
ncbi:MAG: hypothetical protein WAW88_08445, partial [Nocardioides sp.]